MTVVFDQHLGVSAAVVNCRHCGQPIYWSLKANGRRATFDLDADGHPTREPHSSRCRSRGKHAQRQDFQSWR